MQKIDNSRIEMKGNVKAVSAGSARRAWLRTAVIVLAGAGAVFTCYQMINDRLAVDSAAFIIAGCVICVMVGTAFIDRLGL